MAYLVKLAIKHNKKMFKKGQVLSKEDIDHMGASFSSLEKQGYFFEDAAKDVAAVEVKKAPAAPKVEKK